jgi:hypothetical protein
MPLVVRDEEVAGPDKETNASDGQTGARPARRFLAKLKHTTTSADRLQLEEASLVTTIRGMELDLDPENVTNHEALVQQMLQNLEREHNDFITKELLDVNKEPQKSYMSEIEGKVSRALKSHRTKLQLPPEPHQPTDRELQQEKEKQLNS